MDVKRADSPILTRHKRPRTARSERTVNFAKNDQVLEISTREGFSRQELNFLYMSKSEHKRIQLEIVDLIREYRSRQFSWEGEEKERLRGLESLTNHDDGGRLLRMKSAVSAVVERQIYGSIDEMWLSKVYRPYSRVAQSWAHQRALMDSRAAFSDAPRAIVMSR